MTEYTKALNERFLLQKEYLGENKSVNNITPVVSVTVATYQHVNYIKECLDGILMQKTNFPIEIIIGEDGSTDGTQEICKEYAHAHTDKIRLFIRDRKLSQYKDKDGSIQRFNGLWNRMSCRGKYIAFCEGDDYWTDPLKLQKQVDFLEANPEYVLCGHNITAYNERTASFESFNTGIDGTYELTDLISKGVFCSTLSVIFKREALVLERYNSYRKVIDITLAYHLLSQGKGYCMNEEMAVYRIHDGGIWSGSNDDARIVTNIEIRTAIYDVEKSGEAATFLEAFLYNLGRLWIIRHLPIFSKAIHRVFLQFGLAHTAKTLMNILSKFSKP